MANPPSQPDRRRVFPYALIAFGVVALLAAAGLAGAAVLSHEDERSKRSADSEDTFVSLPVGSDRPSSPSVAKRRQTPCYPSAHVRRKTALFKAPDGRRRLTLTPRTEWGSPRILGVVKRRPGWLGVQTAELDNGEVGWLPRSRARLLCSRWSLHTDLSERVISVRRDGKVVRRLRTAIGRAENPTPRGRFSVTDKLRVTDPGSPYGCCVLALTGHQTNLPYGWPGGDRLAVHSTADTASIGQAASSGCMRIDAGQARWLVNTIPIGAPIFVRA
jgi:hypothetical protein